MSKTTTVSWSHEGRDYQVTVSVSGGRKQTYGQPEEHPELEVVEIEWDGAPVDRMAEELYGIAQESDEVYERAMEQLSARYDDEDRGRHY